MSAAAKVSRLGMYHAFSAGRHMAQREGWMQRARVAKILGESPESIRQSVQFARERNRELVRRLRSMSARIPFEDYDRERRISQTGAFGRVPYNPPAGSLEPL